MASWFDFDEFIRPQHLSGPTTLTIARWGTREVYEARKRKKELRAVLWFREWERDEQYLFLNATNRGVLGDAFGDNPDTCIGKRVTLVRDMLPTGKETIVLTIAGDAAPTPRPANGGKKSSDAATQFWMCVSEHKIDRELAKQYIAEAQNNFNTALETLMKECAARGKGANDGEKSE